MGRDRRQTPAAGSVGRAASLPAELQSRIPKPYETWDKGTSWQLVLRSRLPAIAAYDPATRAGSWVAVKTCPLGVMDPRREQKGSPPVVGILFHIGGKKIPVSLGALCPARPRGGMGQVGHERARWRRACARARSGGTGTGRVVLSSDSRRISTSPDSAVVGPDAQRDSRWAGKIRSGHILNGTGPATKPGGWFSRQRPLAFPCRMTARVARDACEIT